MADQTNLFTHAMMPADHFNWPLLVEQLGLNTPQCPISRADRLHINKTDRKAVSMEKAGTRLLLLPRLFLLLQKSIVLSFTSHRRSDDSYFHLLLVP